MKNYVKKVICFILILASTLISGCGEENTYQSSLVNTGDSLVSDFAVSEIINEEEDTQTSKEDLSSFVSSQSESVSSASTSSTLVQSEMESSEPASSSSTSSKKVSSKTTSSASTSSKKVSSKQAPSALVSSEKVSSKQAPSTLVSSEKVSSKQTSSTLVSSEIVSSEQATSDLVSSEIVSSKPTSSVSMSSEKVSSVLSSSALTQSENTGSMPNSSILVQGQSSQSSNATATSSESNIKPNKKSFRAIWISYFEFPFRGSTEEEAKEKVAAMMEGIANQGYTAVFGHVRANADAFYPSKYFPFAKQLTGVAGKDPGYDPLEIMIWAAKKYGLEFHAWINPYRVTAATSNPNELAQGHIAAKWLADGSNRAVVHGKGIYFNPACADVQKLILDGIREILDNYDVDGIHFDDYFYPSGISEGFDSKQYNEYLKTAKVPLSLGDWRRANVNSLVSAAYRLCHSKKTVFGISPAGNMSLDNSHDNYKYLYADIALWMREEGYIDYILPQLYFGYNHPVKRARYKTLLDIWVALPKHKNLKLYIGLGAYKMNENCEDKAEWHNETDLLARQVTDAIQSGADGIAVYSYTASTLNNPHNILQIKNMFDAIDRLF